MKKSEKDKDKKEGAPKKSKDSAASSDQPKTATEKPTKSSATSTVPKPPQVAAVAPAPVPAPRPAAASTHASIVPKPARPAPASTEPPTQPPPTKKVATTLGSASSFTTARSFGIHGLSAVPPPPLRTAAPTRPQDVDRDEPFVVYKGGWKLASPCLLFADVPNKGSDNLRLLVRPESLLAPSTSNSRTGGRE